ncbi:hypothetical protein ASPVEDRAFT_35483 [Aspergillus versicolor CBS 583.65]|uniref:Uncharacterized protein n=1 Tax=Aspergillus versicolor CBS 583.65 TaxID=1036611 RepID=A0A1L9P3P1_ASPVE|nr:uncharacterized protein ASPVEDRAFT_35483 [Aspergillus versicolor CBS 583.65]OJI96140.1 hypothetical protein ASPVEDRAFT_35483 [Aspergillus versicolor CBS 583.65]
MGLIQMEPKVADLVIIGAGWHGLAAAKTALSLDPSINLVVLDSAASVGGVWAEERVYEGLRTNNRVESYVYSDFPIQKATAVAGLVKPGEHMSGRAVHQYLKAYADHFGIHERVRFNCKVETVEYAEEVGVWTIQCTTAAAGEEAIWTTRKLILATGLTSQPRIPMFDGQGSFGAALFHVKEFAHYQNTLFANKPAGDDCTAPIAILGGGKSAWDAVYTCASQGHQVNWIIRASGAGPSWMTPAAVFSPLNLLLESLPLIRALGVFSPCIWASNPIRRFLHGTWLGRMIVRLFWASLEWDMLRTNRYQDHEETAKLRPSYKMIWAGTAVAILNFPGDFFGLVRRGLVKVHIADVERLERKTVVLSNQERLPTRGLILCTGWKASPGIRFLPDGIERDLGFPWVANLVDQQDLVQDTRQELYTRLPMLQTAPARRMYRTKDAQGQHVDEIVLHPFRLARFMVPPELWDDHSIAILGTVATFNTPLVAEVQALWALVYLNHAPELTRHHPQDKKSALREATLHSEFVALRSPTNHGSRNADFVFEVLPYLDMLLRDLGLRTARKGSWWRNLFVPHQPGDYAGLVEEWKGRVSSLGRKIKAA